MRRPPGAAVTRWPSQPASPCCPTCASAGWRPSRRASATRPARGSISVSSRRSSRRSAASCSSRGASAAAPHWQARGLEPTPHAGLYRHLYIDPFPPSLQLPGGAGIERQAARLTPQVATDRDAAPAWLTGLPRQPTVYATFGTVWNRQLDLFGAVLAAVPDTGVNLVMTVGANGDPAALGPQPPHVQVHRFVPQARLLPFCDAVVCHGGSGTLLGGVAHGLPQLLLPQGADQFDNAALITAAGAAHALLPGECSPDAIRRALVDVLGDAALREAAGRLRDELDAMPSPDVAMTRIETLVG